MGEVAPETRGTPSSDRRVALLGKGGFGEVELILRREGRFERLYARKRLLAAHQEDHELRSMFFEEARLAGMLRHPNVVSVLDVGSDEQGPFLLMDYVEGVSVQRLIEAARSQRQPVPLQVCLRIAMQAAEGLHAAHELCDLEGRSLGLVHRDVSPANILVGYDGVARVTDFGVARALGRTTRTATGFLKGKFGYMSPEQLRFEEPDRRSDLFALGVVLFELLTSERLYANNDGMDGARRALNEPPPDLADHRDDVPEALVQLLFSLLAKQAVHRPSDAKTVAARLEAIGAALAVEEGRIDVAEYLAELVGPDRQRGQAALSSALAEEAGATLVPPTTLKVPRRGSPWPWISAAGLSLGLGLYWWSQQGAPLPASPSTPVVTAESGPSPAPRPASPEATLPGDPEEPSVEPEAEPSPADPDPGTAEAGPDPSPSPKVPSEVAPKRRRVIRRPKSEPKPGVPMWSW